MQLKGLQQIISIFFFLAFIFLTGTVKAQIANQTIDTITNNSINEYIDNQAMVIDAANTVHLVYRRDSSGTNILKYTKRECFANWTTPVTINMQGEDVLSYAIEASACGQPYIAYQTSANNGNIKLATETGGVWSSTAITNNSTLHMDVAIAIDASNNLHLAWITENSSGIYKIAYANNISGSWSVQVISNVNLGNFGTGADPYIAVTPGGVAHITYRSAASTNYQVEKVTNGTPGGSTWTTQLVPSPLLINYNGIIVIDEDSTIHVAVNGNNGFGPSFSPSTYYSKQTAGSNTWSIPQLVDVDFNGSAFGMDIDDAGNAHIVYEEVSGNFIIGAIHYSTNATAGGNFVDTVLLNNATSFGGVIQLNNEGLIYIAVFSNDIGVDNEIYVIRNGLCDVLPQMPVADFTANVTTICEGDTVSFTDTTPGLTTCNRSWTFSGGNPTASSQKNPKVIYNTPGVYNVTLSVTNSVGTDTETKTGYITVLAKPIVSIGKDTAICIGGSAQLNASGGVSYSWSPSAGLNDPLLQNPVATPSSTTNYIVTVTGSNGCKAKDTTMITVNPLPIADAGNSRSICEGATTQLVATGGVSYVWSPIASLSNPNIANPIATPPVTTTYTVTVTNATGCKATDTVKINVFASPLANAGADVVYCSGTGVQLNATGGVSYNWSPATGLSSTNIANPLAAPTVATDYVVTVFNNAGCSAKDTVKVTLAAPPVATTSSDVSICAGSSTTLSASGGISYSWAPPASLNNSAIQGPTATPLATTIYTVTVKDANGCTATDNVMITVDPLPAANAGGDAIICTGSSIQLNASGGAQYSWSPTTGLSNAMIANPIASPATNTTYVVTVVGSNNCVNTDTVNISVNPSVVATTNNDTTVCAGQVVQLSASGGDAYQWSPAVGLNSTTIANPVANPASTTNYMVIASKTNCLPDTAYITVTVNPAPAISFLPATPSVCAGSSIQLAASGGTNYSWSPGTGLSNAAVANPVANPATTTIYTVTATDNAGCAGTNSITVTVLPAPSVSASADVTICSGEKASLTASGAASYTWAPSAGISNPNLASISVSPINTTNYIVTGTASNGCTGKDTVTVFVQPGLNVITNNDTSICAGNSVQLAASGGGTYLWSPSTGLDNPSVSSPIATPGVTTTYSVTVSAGSCQPVIKTVTVTVDPNPVTPVIIKTGNVLSVNNSYNFYQWYLDGNIIPGATGATHTITQAGNYTVKVKNQFGCSATSEQLYGFGVGINELADGNKIDLFGYGNTINIRFTGPVQNYNASVVNMLGQQVYYKGNLNQQQMEIDMQHSAAGIYMVTIDVQGQKIVHKVHLE